MKFNILSVARDELFEAIEHYHQESPGLGFEFAAEIRRTFARILELPSAWHPLSKNTRRCRLKRFPYGVIYHHGHDEIVVLAIMHSHRHPSSWKNRE